MIDLSIKLRLLPDDVVVSPAGLAAAGPVL